MNKIAVISDVHGNLEALKATLQDIKKRQIDVIYCLGDIIAKGTNQEECVKLIRENCKVVLKGNCDEYFTSEIDLSKKMKFKLKELIGINQKYLRNHLII